MDDFSTAFRGGYRKRAFLSQYNLILLFGAAAFAIASASWVPLAAAAVVEIAWLVSAPGFVPFRFWVDLSPPEATPTPLAEPVLSLGAPVDGPYRARRVRLTAS